MYLLSKIGQRDTFPSIQPTRLYPFALSQKSYQKWTAPCQSYLSTNNLDSQVFYSISFKSNPLVAQFPASTSPTFRSKIHEAPHPIALTTQWPRPFAPL